MSRYHNGQWDYDNKDSAWQQAQEDTARRQQEYRQQAYQRQQEFQTRMQQRKSSFQKRDNSGWRWLIIVAGFVIWWPAGLALLLAHTTGAWDKFSRQRAERTAQQASQQQSQTAYTAPQTPEPRVTARQKKAATQNDMRRWGIGKSKGFRVAGGILFVLGLLMLLTEIPEDIAAAMTVSKIVSECAPFLGITLLGAGFWGIAEGRTRKARRFHKYLTLVGNKETVPISALASAMGRKESKVIRDLEEMLEREIFARGYVDYSRSLLVLGDFVPEEEPVPEPAADVPESETMQTLRHIRELNDAIAHPKLSEQIYRIEELTGKIFRWAEEHPDRKSELRTFTGYYLPQTMKLLERYANMEAQGVSGSNIDEAKKQIEDAMGKMVDVYEAQLDKLFASDMMDISADLKVMEQMLAKDGLTDDYELKI